MAHLMPRDEILYQALAELGDMAEHLVAYVLKRDCGDLTLRGFALRMRDLACAGMWAAQHGPAEHVDAHTALLGSPPEEDIGAD